MWKTQEELPDWATKGVVRGGRVIQSSEKLQATLETLAFHTANDQPLNFWGIYFIGKTTFKLLFHGLFRSVGEAFTSWLLCLPLRALIWFELLTIQRRVETDKKLLGKIADCFVNLQRQLVVVRFCTFGGNQCVIVMCLYYIDTYTFAATL